MAPLTPERLLHEIAAIQAKVAARHRPSRIAAGRAQPADDLALSSQQFFF